VDSSVVEGGERSGIIPAAGRLNPSMGAWLSPSGRQTPALGLTPVFECGGCVGGSVKTVTVIFYARDFAGEWKYELEESKLREMFAALNSELSAAGVKFEYQHEPNITLRINGYADLLNSVRLRSLHDGIASLPLAQLIGASVNADLLEDVRKGARRVAFSPESIPPVDGAQLCHNCGCGC